MIYVWDEIAGEVKAVTEDFPAMEGTGILDDGSFDPFDVGYHERDGEPWGWKTEHVIDLPDGTRIVIEQDERAHTAVWVTTKED